MRRKGRKNGRVFLKSPNEKGVESKYGYKSVWRCSKGLAFSCSNNKVGERKIKKEETKGTGNCERKKHGEWYGEVKEESRRGAKEGPGGENIRGRAVIALALRSSPLQRMFESPS